MEQSKKIYRRRHHALLAKRLEEPIHFIEVLMGPRQVGKTTLVKQLIQQTPGRYHYASADSPLPRDVTWIEQQWNVAKQILNQRDDAVLVLDEINKVPHWAETVKTLWDRDRMEDRPLKVVLLGSAPLLIRHGLSALLTGRFELIHMPHWTFGEMRDAFGVDVETFLYFGAYPGAAPLFSDEQRWSAYIIDSMVEPTLSRDILQMERIEKPMLLRQLFMLGCEASGQVLSYQKMLGQLQDAGNTTTLAHYLELLSAAGLVTGLQKYSGSRLRKRASSPKLLVCNTSLMTAVSGVSRHAAFTDPEIRGRLAESAVGAHLLACASVTRARVFYWRERNREVDFVFEQGGRLTAIEVKSGQKKVSLPGMAAFSRVHGECEKVLVGGQGMSLEQFLLSDPTSFK